MEKWFAPANNEQVTFLFPAGCTVFEPPGGGGFVCLSAPTMIYCSVYCDNTHDFSTVPHNPYKCGKETKFEWKDLTGVIYEMLPECTSKLLVEASRIQVYHCHKCHRL